jgi:hypothetical protein
VLAVNTTILGLVYPVGALLQGAAGDRWGLAKITGLSGLIYGGVLVSFRLFRHGFSAPLAVSAAT